MFLSFSNEANDQESTGGRFEEKEKEKKKKKEKEEEEEKEKEKEKENMGKKVD